MVAPQENGISDADAGDLTKAGTSPTDPFPGATPDKAASGQSPPSRGTGTARSLRDLPEQCPRDHGAGREDHMVPRVDQVVPKPEGYTNPDTACEQQR